MIKTTHAILLIAGFSALLIIEGCGKSEEAPPPTAAEAQTSSRLDSIYKAAGGDWDKVSADDKKYLIDTVGHGSESTAKLVFGPKPSGRPAAGGPKRTGPPPGAGATK